MEPWQTSLCQQSLKAADISEAIPGEALGGLGELGST